MSDVIYTVKDGADKISQRLTADEPKNYYLVSEEELIEFLENTMERRMNDIDGVNCWEWYGSAYEETKEEFLNEAVQEDYDSGAIRNLSFVDIAKLIINSGAYPCIKAVRDS